MKNTHAQQNGPPTPKKQPRSQHLFSATAMLPYGLAHPNYVALSARGNEKAKASSKGVVKKEDIKITVKRAFAVKPVCKSPGDSKQRVNSHLATKRSARYASDERKANFISSLRRHAANFVNYERPHFAITPKLRYLSQSCIQYYLLLFLDFKEYLNFLLVSKKLFSNSKVKRKILQIILRGLPMAKRTKYWFSKCEAKHWKLEEYRKYLKPDPSLSFDIEKDMDRTFHPGHRFYANSLNKKRLQDVLQAVALKNESVGYIQGLNFIAGHLLMLFNEEVTFQILDSLLNRFGLREFLLESMPKMKTTFYQMNALMKKHIPDISRALEEKEICCELFCVQWFITIFSYDFEAPFLYVIWDLFFIQRWKFVFRLGLAILIQMRKQILSLEDDKLIAYIKSAIRESRLNLTKLISQALRLKITNRELAKLEAEYRAGEDDDKTLPGLLPEEPALKPFFFFPHTNFPNSSKTLPKEERNNKSKLINTPKGKINLCILNSFNEERIVHDFAKRNGVAFNQENSRSVIANEFSRESCNLSSSGMQTLGDVNQAPTPSPMKPNSGQRAKGNFIQIVSVCRITKPSIRSHSKPIPLLKAKFEQLISCFR